MNAGTWLQSWLKRSLAAHRRAVLAWRKAGSHYLDRAEVEAAEAAVMELVAMAGARNGGAS